MPEISPELAQKALDADVRNTLQDVAQGGTMPPSKRQLMLAIAASGATPQDILLSRETALLRKFALGGRLKNEELEEIAHLMPEGASRLPTATYKLEYSSYTLIYGKKKRTIQSWVDQGKAAAGGKDLPPLDSPRDMPVWWKRVMSQRCPPSIEDAARKDLASDSHRLPPSPRGESVSLAPPSLLGETDDAAFGPLSESTADLELRLKQLQQQRDLAYGKLLQAQNDKEKKSEGLVTALMKDWRELDEACSKAESKAIEYRVKIGRYLDAEDLAAQLGPMLSACASAVRSLWHRVKSKLVNAQDEAEEDAIWQRGLDEIFEELDRTDFSETFKLHS